MYLLLVCYCSLLYCFVSDLDKVTRLGVTVRDYIDSQKYVETRQVFQCGQKRDKPAQSQIDDLEAALDNNHLYFPLCSAVCLVCLMLQLRNTTV